LLDLDVLMPVHLCQILKHYVIVNWLVYLIDSLSFQTWYQLIQVVIYCCHCVVVVSRVI
jgi:DNA integrity scanning protein DisA with diadenylate cyclase activity